LAADENLLRMILSARFAGTAAKEALPQELVELANILSTL
jgi:DNA-binding FadR family transcriptional regulator